MKKNSYFKSGSGTRKAFVSTFQDKDELKEVSTFNNKSKIKDRTLSKITDEMPINIMYKKARFNSA